MKLFNLVVKVLFVIGIFCIIGSAGMSDVATELKVYYPVFNTIRELLFGFLCILPQMSKLIYSEVR